MERIALKTNRASACASPDTAETNVVPTLGPPQNKEWAIGLACNSNVPRAFVTSIDLDQTFMFGSVRKIPGEVPNIHKCRYRQGAADCCRRPVSIRERLALAFLLVETNRKLVLYKECRNETCQ